MTDDGSEADGSTNEPGEVVERAISDITAAADAESVATTTARAFERLFGTRVECFLHGDDGELIAAGTSDDTEPTAALVELDGTPAAGELSWPADPLLVPVDDAGWLVCRADGDGRAPTWAVRSLARVAVDAATQRVRQRETARRIEELEAETDQLANFANIVAHDLRNPLAIAQGNLELAREHADEEHFEKIADAHDRIQRIIDHTLTMAKQDGDGALTERIETGSVAHDAWDTVETGGATLTVSDSLRVVADQDRLQQLFENFFRNAVEHGTTSPASQTRQDAVEHGSTSPRSSSTPEDADEQSSSSPPSHAPADAVEHGVPEQQVEQTGETDYTAGTGLAVEVGTLTDDAGFFVADNGPGIPEDERTAVFDQGYSDDGGTGLGLSIIDDIVTEHDWSITVAEGRAGGARFEIDTE